MNPRLIRHAPHHTIKSINLSNKMTLSETTYCRIAGHFTDRSEMGGKQCCSRATTRSGTGGLNAGMAAANDDHIIQCAHTRLGLSDSTNAIDL